MVIKNHNNSNHTCDWQKEISMKQKKNNLYKYKIQWLNTVQSTLTLRTNFAEVYPNKGKEYNKCTK